MRVTVIPIVTGVLRIIPNGLGRDWKSWKSEDELRPSRSSFVEIG